MPLKKQSSSQLATGEKTKNVSHVPCKFFRQSICQAGDKCPFSHDLSADTTQMVCKYFQRGNCKFGAKCALLHITPDGKSQKKKSKSKKTEEKEVKPELKAEKDLKKKDKRKKKDESSEQDVVVLATQILSKYNGQPIKRTQSLPGSTPWRTKGSTDEFAIADEEDSTLQVRNFTEFGSLLNRRLNSEYSIEDHAIEEEEEEEEEEGYTEQLVPSVLEDLLTPQERERRNSCNSQKKSGRVFSSPSLTSPLNLQKRRTSTSSEPSGDLWGPRQVATPFSRGTNHLSSPPLNSAPLVSSSSSALSSPIISSATVYGSGSNTPKMHTFTSEPQINLWGLSNLVIRENDENFQHKEQKNLYHPFQRYQFLSEKT